MDWGVVIVALISLLGTIVTSLISYSRIQGIMEYKISVLTDEVKKHNGLVDRMYKVEAEIKLINEKLDNI